MAVDVSDLFGDTVYDAIKEAIAKKIGVDAASDTSNAINKYIDDIANDPEKLAAILKNKGKSNSAVRNTVTPKQLAKATKAYKVPLSQRAVSEIVLPVLGDTSSAIGSSIAIKNSLLGSALESMSNKGSNARREQFGPSAADIASAYGAPQFKIRAATAQMLGDTAANRLYTVADKEASEIDKARALAQQQLDRPSSAYYDYLNGIEHRNNAAGSRGNTSGSGGIKVSDERMKSILNNKGHMLPEDVQYLIEHAGAMDNMHDFAKDGNTWDDDVLDKYAHFIKNYLYTYKPEAAQIDSRIDPEQMQIGPMAQDIEKVNPSCIVETPEGVKTVDTGKLALMNAGAIADLARKIEEAD